MEALKNIMEGLAEGLHSLLVGILASLNIRGSYYTYREKNKQFSGGPEEHYRGYCSRSFSPSCWGPRRSEH